MSRRQLILSAAFVAAAAIALAVGGTSAGVAGDPTVTVDKVFVEKSARRLTLLQGGKQLRVYRVALGAHPVGPKERQGDGRTPEGTYVIDYRVADSAYHRALHISYPNAEDRARAASLACRPAATS